MLEFLGGMGGYWALPALILEWDANQTPVKVSNAPAA